MHKAYSKCTHTFEYILRVTVVTIFLPLKKFL